MDIEAWVTKSEAAKTLGIGIRTIERLISKGEIQQQYRSLPRRRPIAVLHPGDIERIREKMIAPTPAPALTVPAPLPQRGTALTDRMVISRIRLPEKFLLSIIEASTLSGLPQTAIRRLIASGELGAVRMPRLLVSRKQLEHVCERLVSQDAIATDAIRREIDAVIQ